MKQLIDDYTNAPELENLRDLNAWIAQRRRLQTEFYSALHYYEDLLFPTTHPTPPPSHIEPYVPWVPPPRRGRGRSFTGGRKPRDRRSTVDDDYKPN